MKINYFLIFTLLIGHITSSATLNDTVSDLLEKFMNRFKASAEENQQHKTLVSGEYIIKSYDPKSGIISAYPYGNPFDEDIFQIYEREHRFTYKEKTYSAIIIRSTKETTLGNTNNYYDGNNNFISSYNNFIGSFCSNKELMDDDFTYEKYQHCIDTFFVKKKQVTPVIFAIKQDENIVARFIVAYIDINGKRVSAILASSFLAETCNANAHEALLKMIELDAKNRDHDGVTNNTARSETNNWWKQQGYKDYTYKKLT